MASYNFNPDCGKIASPASFNHVSDSILDIASLIQDSIYASRPSREDRMLSGSDISSKSMSKHKDVSARALQMFGNALSDIFNRIGI